MYTGKCTWGLSEAEETSSDEESKKDKSCLMAGKNSNVSKSSSSHDSNASIPSLQERYDILFENIELVDDKRAHYKREYKSTLNELNGLINTHNELKLKFKEQRKMLDAVDDKAIQSITNELDMANDEVASLRLDVKHLGKESEHLANVLKDANERLQATVATKCKLEAKCLALEKGKEKLIDSTYNDTLASYEIKVRELEQENERLNTTIKNFTSSQQKVDKVVVQFHPKNNRHGLGYVPPHTQPHVSRKKHTRRKKKTKKNVNASTSSSHVHKASSHSHKSHIVCSYCGRGGHYMVDCWQRAYEHRNYLPSIYLTQDYHVANQYGPKQVWVPKGASSFVGAPPPLKN